VTKRFVGLTISLLGHGLLFLIPVSLAVTEVKTYPPVELVMTWAEKPAPEPPAPEPPKVKPQPQPRPKPRPREPEPITTQTYIPPPVAARPSPVVPPRPAVTRGTGAPTGPLVTEFGSATGPAFLRRVLPVYPEQARRLGKEGRVVLRLHIDARGNLQRVEVAEGAGFGFEEAAIRAVQQSSFRPAMVQGEPRASIARLPIRFALKN